MTIIALGSLEHNTWFCHRLSQRGLAVRSGEDSGTHLPGLLKQVNFAGLLSGNCLIDTGNSSLAERHELARLCLGQGLEYAELSGHWLRLGEEHGFPLFVGTQATTRPHLQPILDALAPQASAWLYCGPPGAACYTSRIFDALSLVCALAIKAGWASPGTAPQAPDWATFFAEQQILSDKLLEISRLYLSFHPETTELDPWQQLKEFNQTPSQQLHFAANLARLIVLALGQRQALQEIFERLLQAA